MFEGVTMSKFSALVVVLVLLLAAWFSFACMEGSRIRRENRNQDILMHAGLPICQAPKADENDDEQVDHMDTKEVA